MGIVPTNDTPKWFNIQQGYGDRFEGALNSQSHIHPSQDRRRSQELVVNAKAISEHANGARTQQVVANKKAPSALDFRQHICKLCFTIEKAHQVAQTERAHWHAKHALDDVVDHVDVHSKVGQEAGRHRVWKENAIDSEPSAVAHHDRRLFDLETQLQRVQDYLKGSIPSDWRSISALQPSASTIRQTCHNERFPELQPQRFE
jgi:hypothetical protein